MVNRAVTGAEDVHAARFPCPLFSAGDRGTFDPDRALVARALGSGLGGCGLIDLERGPQKRNASRQFVVRRRISALEGARDRVVGHNITER